LIQTGLKLQAKPTDSAAAVGRDMHSLSDKNRGETAGEKSIKGAYLTVPKTLAAPRFFPFFPLKNASI
jgi:hypothetical protein